MIEQITGGPIPGVLRLENIRVEGEGSREERPDPEGGLGHGGVALATAPPKVRFTAEAEIERYARKRSRLSVRHVSGDRVVAMLEVVSPGNKASAHALRSFVDKSLELLEAGIHLLIVDLFPPGPRDPQGIHGALWSEIEDDGFRLPGDQRLTLAAYSVGELKRAFVEPVTADGSRARARPAQGSSSEIQGLSNLLLLPKGLPIAPKGYGDQWSRL